MVIVLNVSIGFLQEYKAEKKMDALRALSSPSASVIRDGKVQVISKYVSHLCYNPDWPPPQHLNLIIKYTFHVIQPVHHLSPANCFLVPK